MICRNNNTARTELQYTQHINYNGQKKIQKVKELHKMECISCCSVDHSRWAWNIGNFTDAFLSEHSVAAVMLYTRTHCCSPNFSSSNPFQSDFQFSSSNLKPGIEMEQESPQKYADNC